jgi:transcriptional regulator with XRE-family HTH domain
MVGGDHGTVQPHRRGTTQGGLTKEQLARRAGTSRPTLSAYEHHRKSPRLDTVERLLAETGFALAVEPIIHFQRLTTRRHRIAWVPDQLPRLSIDAAVGIVTLPLHLAWSHEKRMIQLANRTDRTRCYEVVLREGTPHDILRYVDGALLVDTWTELVLPAEIRRAWQPLIEEVTASEK